MRILIIEDEPMIAFDLRDLLEDAGFDVIGVAGNLATALALIKSKAFDAAILDANLAGVSSSPAAAALAQRGVPFIVLSGYSLKQQDTATINARFIQKPCQPEHLISALKAIRLQA
jgi:DNA-binding response OmpR family regulator